jgi:hypothetical protein
MQSWPLELWDLPHSAYGVLIGAGRELPKSIDVVALLIGEFKIEACVGFPGYI